MSRFNLELLLKIVSAVIRAVIAVLFGIKDDEPVDSVS